MRSVDEMTEADMRRLQRHMIDALVAFARKNGYSGFSVCDVDYYRRVQDAIQEEWLWSKAMKERQKMLLSMA